ncbi:MAG TPA: NAD-dependent succinate-semialdehyde dehydrogenase [Acidimicrobiales bacterium]|nr:NAD-dependent succinate-semialdehyde dehydrogenase [Acidimicrobiales bacterium]
MPFATVNPTTGQTEKTFPAHTPEEVEARLSRATSAFAEYRKTTFAERAGYVTAAADLFDKEAEDIARMVSTEMGKTVAAARGEVTKCASALRWFAEHAEALLADEPIVTGATSSFVHYQPIGPVLAIMPWNFPLWQVIRFAAPALMVGNVGLLKHAPNVPQTAQFLEDVFRRAGLPEGVFTNLFVETEDVAAIIEDPRVAAVTLTGSERAGMSVAATAGQVLKKCVLELGGSDPFIVLESADLDAAVRTGVASRLLSNGQSCIAAKRFIVVEPIADEFIARFTEAMNNLVVGDPQDPATDVGPIVTEAQRAQLVAQVEDARSQGAEVHVREAAFDGPGWFLAPTVLTGITPDMRVAQQELFGPVAMVERVPDLEAALRVANSTTFGLGSSVWTRDEDEIRRCIEEVEAGQVFVNAMVVSTPELPFGGIKRSGFGRELSELGLKEFCNAKTVWIT